MSLDRLARDAPIDKLVGVMDRDGVAILEQMLGPGMVEPLRDAIQSKARDRAGSSDAGAGRGRQEIRRLAHDPLLEHRRAAPCVFLIES